MKSNQKTKVKAENFSLDLKTNEHLITSFDASVFFLARLQASFVTVLK